MKFSILIPVYNVEKYLEQCLESVISQTYKNFEVILVNDGSTDGSRVICDKYAKNYPDKIRVFHKENEGLLLTRRFSLKKARGEYIIFVDSDDYVDETLLEVLEDGFKSYECDMLLYNFVRFVEGEDGTSSPKIPFQDGTIFEGDKKHELYEAFILRHTFSNMWIKAIRKDKIDIDANYVPWNVSRSEDVIQTPPLFTNAQKIVFIDKKIYHYRKNTGSTTARISSKDCNNFLKVSKRLYQYIDIWKLQPEIKFLFAAERMSFFYTYLRDISRKAKNEKDKNLLLDVVKTLGSSEEFQVILTQYNSNYTSKRLRGRLSSFQKAMLKKNWKKVVRNVKFSNFVGDLLNNGK